MPVQVTLDIFSGRPNPTIRLSGRDADEILSRAAAAGRSGPRSKLQSIPPVLGYRGLIIEQIGRPARGLPGSFRVAAGHIFPGGPKGGAVTTADPDLERDLLGRTAFIRRFDEPGLTPKHLHGDLERLLRIFELFPIKVRFPIRAVCPCAPVYEPAWWNDGGQRQSNNNCYNYGCNHRTDTFAQPGQCSGQIYTSITGPAVRDAALRDDLEDAPNNDNKCPAAGHLVALVIKPAGWKDFHWYRKGRNGRWTHKPGSTQATNLDNAGAIITDPRTADRGGYTEFITFMVVKHGHIRII